MTSINLSEHADLPDRLQIDFSPGRISLERNRMVLLHASAMASLRKELIDNLGIQRARGVLTRMGYESGKKDAELARRLLFAGLKLVTPRDIPAPSWVALFFTGK